MRVHPAFEGNQMNVLPLMQAWSRDVNRAIRNSLAEAKVSQVSEGELQNVICGDLKAGLSGHPYSNLGLPQD